VSARGFQARDVWARVRRMRTSGPHRHPAWAWVRGAIVALNVPHFLTTPAEPGVPPMGWTGVFLGTAFAALAPIFLIAGNPLAPDQAPPSWRANPFSPFQPVQFFHLGAWVFMAGGLAQLAGALARGEAVIPELFVPIGMGAGAWAACRVIPPVRRPKAPNGP
jgi:hypothetical protein